MKVSISELEHIIDEDTKCYRRWYFLKKLKLPVFKKAYFGIGSVLHGCCERYLLGADDPFAVGWDIDPDSKKRIAPGDASLVRLLVEKGIEAGYLERRPGQRVEQWFTIEVDGHQFVGKKDVESPARIEDHKTSKNTRYLKSKEKLKKNAQLLSYAYEQLVQTRKRGEMDPRIFTLVHNQFVTDREAPEVRRREVEVTPEEIDHFWNTVIRPGIKKIEELSQVEDPWTIPDPDKKACESYGGCPFLTLCSGSEEILTYSARITNMLKQQPMANVQDFLKARAGGVPPASAAPAVNPPSNGTPAPAAAPAPNKPAAPPWAVSNCGLCSTTATPGFKPGKGTPCRICVSISKVSLLDYEWKIEADGKVTWWKKGEQVAETPPPPPVEDKGSKAAYTVDALYAKLKEAKTIERVVEIIKEAEGVLGVGSTDFATFSATADARMETIEVEPEPSPKPTTAAEVTQMIDAQMPKILANQPPLTAASTVAPVAPVAPAPEVPPKRKRGRPRAAALPVAARDGQQDENGDDVLSVVGFVLLLGCQPIGGTSFPEMKVLFAEALLTNIPGYWANDNVFERRQQLRKAFTEDSKMVEGLDGHVIVQQGRDPDVDNLMSTLLCCKPALVLRGTV
jgi:hypothetical protein